MGSRNKDGSAALRARGGGLRVRARACATRPCMDVCGWLIAANLQFSFGVGPIVIPWEYAANNSHRMDSTDTCGIRHCDIPTGIRHHAASIPWAHHFTLPCSVHHTAHTLDLAQSVPAKSPAESLGQPHDLPIRSCYAFRLESEACPNRQPPRTPGRRRRRRFIRTFCRVGVRRLGHVVLSRQFGVQVKEVRFAEENAVHFLHHLPPPRLQTISPSCHAMLRARGGRCWTGTEMQVAALKARIAWFG